jgi:hypothetical protein
MPTNSQTHRYSFIIHRYDESFLSGLLFLLMTDQQALAGILEMNILVGDGGCSFNIISLRLSDHPLFFANMSM